MLINNSLHYTIQYACTGQYMVDISSSKTEWCNQSDASMKYGIIFSSFFMWPFSETRADQPSGYGSKYPTKSWHKGHSNKQLFSQDYIHWLETIKVNGKFHAEISHGSTPKYKLLKYLEDEENLWMASKF